jgi:hypothetical protein
MEEVKFYEELKKIFNNEQLKKIINDLPSLTENSIYKWFELNQMDVTNDEFENLNFEDYIDSCFDKVVFDLMNVFETKYNLQVSDEVINDFLCGHQDGEFVSLFESAKARYFNDYGNEQQENQEYTFDDLLEHDDLVGDVLSLVDAKWLDFGSREAPLLYIDNELIVGDGTETHTQLLQEHFDIIDVDDSFYRKGEEELKELGCKGIIFGHLYDNMAFADEVMGNASIDDFVSKCKSKLNVDKVFYLDIGKSCVTRLARCNKLKN